MIRLLRHLRRSSRTGRGPEKSCKKKGTWERRLSSRRFRSGGVEGDKNAPPPRVSHVFLGRCRTFLITILMVGLGPLSAATEVYVSEIRLDRELYTEDGRRLDRGGFDLEVRREEEGCSLVFLQGATVVATVAGEEGAGTETDRVIPLVGTLYLRSTAVPLGTAEERQLSKTGRPQYQDQEQNWENTLRAYRGSEDSEVHFLFQRRRNWGDWEQIRFKLFLEDPAGNR